LFGPKRDEVIRGCRKMHSEERNSVYTTSNVVNNDQFEEDEIGMACSRRGREEECRTELWCENQKARDL
jgi:hypothetical protein